MEIIDGLVIALIISFIVWLISLPVSYFIYRRKEKSK